MRNEGVAGRAAGIHALQDLSEADVATFGDEVRDLVALARAGVPLARGWVAPLHADAALLTERVDAALREPVPVARGSGSLPPPQRRAVRVLPWFRTMALALRAESRWPGGVEVREPADLAAALQALAAQLSAPAMAGALALEPGGLALRVLIADEGSAGRACSVDPDDGDPACVAVWLPGRRPWRLDRKTMRPLTEGEGPLPRSILDRAADLADRAQLALGRPVDLDWVLSSGRPAVARVRPFSATWRFTDEPFRKVALLWHDEGPIAPLAVDALDKALREDGDPVDVLRVRRVFARAYRRVEEGRGRPDEARSPFTTAAARVARAVADVARPIGTARDFSDGLDARLGSFDRDILGQLDDPQLIRALRERQGVVIEAYALLDQARKATAAVLGALEAALGTLPHECVQGLAAIRRTRARRKLDERLAKAAAQLGELPVEVDPVPAAHRRTFADLRRELADLRPLGLDVRPLSYGASDAALVEGMRAARDGRAERAEQEQRQAIRRLMATARARPLGLGRAALARTLTVVVEQLADAKGRVAEGLAEANLRVRAVALEIGRRLVERGVLDEPEDVLYLYGPEVQDAVFGEPGAYTARVRLRREEDARWRSLDPPTRLPARARPLRPTW